MEGDPNVDVRYPDMALLDEMSDPRPPREDMPRIRTATCGLREDRGASSSFDRDLSLIEIH